MIIAGLDQSETVRLQKRFARRRESLSRLESPSSSKSIGIDIVDTQSDEDNDDSDVEYVVPETPQSSSKQMRVNLPSLALACDRHGVSDRAAAGIASAVLQDVGIIHQDDATKVIDRNKVRRERSKKRVALRMEASYTITGLYFDGRKDKTLAQKKKKKTS